MRFVSLLDSYRRNWFVFSELLPNLSRRRPRSDTIKRLNQYQFLVNFNSILPILLIFVSLSLSFPLRRGKDANNRRKWIVWFELSISPRMETRQFLEQANYSTRDKARLFLTKRVKISPRVCARRYTNSRSISLVTSLYRSRQSERAISMGHYRVSVAALI